MKTNRLNPRHCAAILLACLLPGCASTRLKYLEPEAFVRQGMDMERVNSAQWVQLVGASSTRAYLEYQDLITWNGSPRTVVYWTRLDALPDEIQRPLKSGQSPWYPWQPEAKPGDRVMNVLPTK